MKLFRRLFNLFKKTVLPYDIKTIQRDDIYIVYGGNKVGRASSFELMSEPDKNHPECPHIYIHRARFDKMMIAEMFSGGFIHIQSQKWPFDIEVVENGKLNLLAKNVWLTSIQYVYKVDGWFLVEGIQAICENVIESD